MCTLAAHAHTNKMPGGQADSPTFCRASIVHIHPSKRIRPDREEGLGESVTQASVGAYLASSRSCSKATFVVLCP